MMNHFYIAIFLGEYIWYSVPWFCNSDDIFLTLFISEVHPMEPFLLIREFSHSMREELATLRAVNDSCCDLLQFNP